MPPNQEQTPDPTATPNEPAAPQQSYGQVISPSGGMKVVQPLGGGVQPVVSSSSSTIENQAATPSVIVPNVSQPTAAPTSPTISSTPQNIYPQPQSGMSRSEIEAEAEKENKKKRFKKMLLLAPIGLVIVAAIVIGLLFVKNTLLSNFHTVSYDSKGYTYSFKWWKKGGEASLQGAQFYGYKTSAYVATELAVPFGNKYSTCTQIPSSPYTQVFTVKVGAATFPVCTNQTNGQYFMIFSGAGHNQLFQVAFTPPPSDPTSVYPALKTIFSSVQASQD